MDDLRLILLFIGVALIAAIYGWGRLKGRLRPSFKRRPKKTPNHPPSGDTPDDSAIEQELARMQRAMRDDEDDAAATTRADATPQSRAPAADLEDIMVISVESVSGEPFSGDALARAFANNDLFYGDKAIFHRMVRLSGEDISVFGVANLFKPGHFGNGDLSDFETAGITLFLELPAPIDGLQAYDDFVQTAERLAVELGGQLKDHTHSVVTHQALMHKRDLLAKSRLRAPLSA